jgi:hypothetical protein
MVRRVHVDGGARFLEASENDVAQNVNGNLSKAASDNAKGARVRRCEMQIDAMASYMPSANQETRIHSLVDTQLECQPRGRLSLNSLQKSEPFALRVRGPHYAEKETIKVVESHEERRGTLADVVVSASPNIAGRQKQSQLDQFQRPASGFLAAAQDDRLPAGSKMRSTRFQTPVVKFGSRYTLKVRVRWGLVSLAPQTQHARWPYPGLASHRTYAPTRPTPQQLGSSLCDDPAPSRIGNRRLCPTAQRILQSRQALPAPSLLPEN